ncbi:MAG: DivIVA domain-containing protein [Oscillospiraceae bacterium]|jgi:cell division septum initiation protein DivIVA|nr:DivIVA domain-containing protein [Oscillospiraceae bacterium]
MLTPEQLKQHRFERLPDGNYNAEEVNRFFGEVIAFYNQMFRENGELLRKITVLANKIVEYKNDENNIRDALLNAQRTGDAVLREAQEEAEELLAAAREEALQIVENAHLETENIVSGRDGIVTRAEEAAAEIVHNANLQAEEIVHAAEEQLGELDTAVREEAVKVLTHANSESAEILSKTNAEAEEVMSAAKADAEALLAQAKLEAEAIVREATEKAQELSDYAEEKARQTLEEMRLKLNDIVAGAEMPPEEETEPEGAAGPESGDEEPAEPENEETVSQNAGDVSGIEVPEDAETVLDDEEGAPDFEDDFDDFSQEALSEPPVEDTDEQTPQEEAADAAQNSVDPPEIADTAFFPAFGAQEAEPKAPVFGMEDSQPITPIIEVLDEELVEQDDIQSFDATASLYDEDTSYNEGTSFDEEASFDEEETLDADESFEDDDDFASFDEDEPLDFYNPQADVPVFPAGEPVFMPRPQEPEDEPEPEFEPEPEPEPFFFFNPGGKSDLEIFAETKADKPFEIHIEDDDFTSFGDLDPANDITESISGKVNRIVSERAEFVPADEDSFSIDFSIFEQDAENEKRKKQRAAAQEAANKDADDEDDFDESFSLKNLFGGKK